METKHHKIHHAPSVIGVFMNFIQTFNSLKGEKISVSKCYICNTEYSREHFQRVNNEFAQFSPEKFSFIVENLGLSRLEVPNEFIVDGSINICSECLHSVEKVYEQPWLTSD